MNAHSHFEIPFLNHLIDDVYKLCLYSVLKFMRAYATAFGELCVQHDGAQCRILYSIYTTIGSIAMSVNEIE